VVSRDALLSAVWPGTVVGDDALTQAVIKLRKALQGHGAFTPIHRDDLQARLPSDCLRGARSRNRRQIGASSRQPPNRGLLRTVTAMSLLRSPFGGVSLYKGRSNWFRPTAQS